MDLVASVVIPFIKSAIIVVGLLVGFAYTTWFERKVCARFQIRYGPNRAGPFGLLQPVADAVKAIFKEEIIPSKADKVLYFIAPGLSMATALLAFAVVPVGRSIHLFGREIPLHLADVNVGVLYLMAVAGLASYGVVLGGWSSNNKYSLLGALRTAAQMISYELPMGLALISILLLVGDLSLVRIVEYQSSLPLIVLQPVAFLIYLICSFAEASRSPFDLPETENELVAGFATEYGGIKFPLFFMAEYIHMITASAIVTTLFLGGWQGPLAHLHPLISLFWFFAKTIFMIFVFVWVRSSTPRVRYDKLMKFCWKFLAPLALVNLAVTAIVVALLT
ncbi:MAG: NADH-quinone oxidoreductase subunit NuoH [Anaerolineae bacterium]